MCERVNKAIPKVTLLRASPNIILAVEWDFIKGMDKIIRHH